MRSFGGNPMWTKFDRVERSDNANKIFAYFQDNSEKTYHCSLLRGGQYVGLNRENVWEQAKKELVYTPDDRYCDFITYDWKNHKVALCDCCPKAMSNYFEPKNDKPFETSPVFFKPEVLDKYKNNPNVYVLGSRQISKIDGWELKTYDINELGQVHTYLGYLSNLQYEEQLYWKSFNEEPKGPISKRAIETDFKGNWSDLRFPDEILIEKLTDAKTKVSFYHKLDLEEAQRIHRVHTDNEKEWGDSLLQLDQIVNESLDNSIIRSMAEKLGCLDKSLGSVRQLQNVFNTFGYDKSHLEPLAELHHLRNIMRGHKKGSDAQKTIKDIRKKYFTFPAHSLDILTRINDAIEFVMEHYKEVNTSASKPNE
jgi:hypothetical protein